MPPIRYADNNGVFIAYRTFGGGDDVIMTSSATLTMETVWPWVKAVAESARVTWYDKRGTGASDGAANFSFEERVDDIRAVMDAAGIQRAHLYGASEGGPQSVIFAAAHPKRVKSLTLYGTYPSFMKRRDRAVSCASAMHKAMAELGLPIRAGIHVGEIEIRSDDDIAGMGVHIAARIAGLAGATQTVVSRTVKDLVVGSAFRFDDLGEHALKGVDEPWQCYTLSV